MPRKQLVKHLHIGAQGKNFRTGESLRPKLPVFVRVHESLHHLPNFHEQSEIGRLPEVQIRAQVRDASAVVRRIGGSQEDNGRIS